MLEPTFSQLVKVMEKPPTLDGVVVQIIDRAKGLFAMHRYEEVCVKPRCRLLPAGPEEASP